VSRVTFAFVSTVLALCVIACGGQSAWAQAAAKPAPTPLPSPANISARVTESLIDSTVADDPAVNKMLEVYAPKVRALDEVIGKLIGDLRKGGLGAGSLGNFVTDGMRVEASQKLGKPVVLSITNSGGLRKNVITGGDLRLRDMFELLPFENALVAFDLTGAQVLDLLRVVVSRRDAQSGARVKYRINSEKQPELETARFMIDGKERELDPAATYTVISIDYLLRVTGGDYATVLSQAKNIRPLELTMRDALTHYVRAETAAGREIKAILDGRFIFNKPGAPEEAPQ
jgi:2',3'-cyclic-nucleotide 2'-phosphodiesterase (5'-nucleotidase family)